MKIVRKNKSKSICFVTGVPGAGKTLVGLDLAIQHKNEKGKDDAVFLSGNGPLVKVLRHALASDAFKRENEKCKKKKKEFYQTKVFKAIKCFIQEVYKYRDAYLTSKNAPPEHIAIFDEAQRAWTKDEIAKFMKNKKHYKEEFNYSEPEFLISTMNRHKDWAVIVCLVGGGQEIYTGEAGLPEWFDSLRRSFPKWNVYITSQLNNEEYRRNCPWNEMTSGLHIVKNQNLHLASSVRSFRTPDLAAFVKAILNANMEEAKFLWKSIQNKYPIRITRNLNKAKEWIRNQCKGTTRYGLLASSGGLRLKTEGIFVKNKISVVNWFLNGKEDVRSSYYLEDVVTEFDIQGLELDYSIVAWDADFRFDDSNKRWTYHCFKGTKWNKVSQEERKLYLKNAYRVLLTRARQGMVIFIPQGDDRDKTRKTKFYDPIYEYFKVIGLDELK